MGSFHLMWVIFYLLSYYAIFGAKRKMTKAKST